MTRLSVRHYEAADRRDWDDLVQRSRTPHFLFARNYMEYHRDRFVDFSLLVHDGSRLVACVPANRDGATVVSHGGLTFGGVISERGMSTHKMLHVFDALSEHLRSVGCSSWIYKAIPHIYHLAPAEEDLYALFRNGARLVRRDVSSAIAMDRRLPYDKGRRSHVKRAHEGGLTLGGSDDVRPFMELMAEVLEERHAVTPAHTGDELQMLRDRFPDAIKLFTASRDGELVGGVVIYETPCVAHVQYMGAGEEGRRLGAVDAIIDSLLSHEYRDTRYFDFGHSIEPRTGDLNLNLIHYKQSYGARAVAYDRYAIDLA